MAREAASSSYEDRRSRIRVPVDLSRSPPEVAPDLLGCVLVHVKNGRVTSGRIVEVEAYAGQGADDCSHAHRRKTPRNKTMYGPTGRLYVYFTYGMHWCANVVAHRPGEAGAILLRALEPIEGIDLMRKRRRVEDDRLLCSGPARLTEAMGIGRRDDGRRLDSERLCLLPGDKPVRTVAGPRVGVTGDAASRPWRFCEDESSWLSRPAGGSPGR
jgi:DNA-3-methyladenine glycosylase